MIAAYWCVLVAGVLPLLCAYVAKFGPSVDAGRYDNREPRTWLAKQTGRRGRANAAQANSFEALPLFAAGVVIATLQRVPSTTIDLLAGIFIVARIVYIAVYVAGFGAVRSVVWVIGFAATVALFVVAAGVV